MTTPHSHTHFTDFTRQVSSRLGLSLALTLSFVLFEALAGWYANSLALLTDAAHNVTDIIALALSLVALRLTTRPASSAKTYGYHRAGILAAFINSSALALIAGGIFLEAFQRLRNPPAVNSGVLLSVGVIALFVNLGTALLIRRGSQHDLNLRSSYVHLLGDVLSTIGAIIAGVGILLTGQYWLDPLVSLLIGMLILWNAWMILRETVHILLESTPSDIDMTEFVQEILKIDGVRGVHDLHVWSITQNLRALSAHILTDDVAISDGAAIQQEVSRVLNQRYNIAHATLQLECANCEPDLLFCSLEENHLV